MQKLHPVRDIAVVGGKYYLRRARTTTKPSAPKAAKAIVPGSGTVIVNVLFIVAESPAVSVKLC